MSGGGHGSLKRRGWGSQEPEAARVCGELQEWVGTGTATHDMASSGDMTLKGISEPALDVPSKSSDSVVVGDEHK